MNKLLIGETLYKTEVKQKNRKFVYLKHKFFKFGEEFTINSPKFLIGKWDKISTILAKDIGIIEKGTKSLYKVSLKEYKRYINLYKDNMKTLHFCKGHNFWEEGLKCNCKGGN